MHETNILTHLLIVLVASLPMALLLRMLGQSTIVGYLLAGLLIGPGVLKLIPGESIELVAEVGVGLLLFEIGIELSLEKLMRMRRVAFGGGTAQVVGTACVTALVTYALSGQLYEAVYVGCAIALSSSAIVLKTLADKGDLDAPYTGPTTAVAIFQDLATVPMMVILPALGSGGTLAAVAVPVGIALGKAVALLAVLYAVSKFLLDPLLHLVARARSPEVFVISIIVIVLAAAAGSQVAGLSLALGAFIAGILLADSKYAHQITAEITPFKGVFQAVFFASIGMLLDPKFILQHPVAVLAVAAAVTAGKAAVAALAVRIAGVPGRTAAAAGVLLSQVGEFSFVLVSMGRNRDLIDVNHYQLVLSASFLTMAVAPPLIANVRAIVDALARLPLLGRALSGAPVDAKLQEATHGHEKHVIVCGFGPIGREVVNFARNHALDHVIIDINPKAVKEFGAQGVPIFFGDFSNPRVLEHAGIERARALILTAPDMEASRRAVKVARASNPGIFIVARTKYHGQAPGLVADGASEVIEEETETAIELVARLGPAFGISRKDAFEDMVEQIAEEDRKAAAAAESQEGPIAPAFSEVVPPPPAEPAMPAGSPYAKMAKKRAERGEKAAKGRG